MNKEKMERRIENLERMIQDESFRHLLRQYKTGELRVHSMLDKKACRVMDWSVVIDKNGFPMMTMLALDDRDHGAIRIITSVEEKKVHIEVINRYANRRFTKLLHSLCLSKKLWQDHHEIDEKRLVEYRLRMIEYFYHEA